MLRRGERGAGTVLTAAVSLTLIGVATMACIVVGWFAAIRRAEQVAELAALAGAGAATRSADVCAAVRDAAARNRAVVARCLVRGSGPDVVVEVGVDAHLRYTLGIVPDRILRLASAGTM